MARNARKTAIYYFMKKKIEREIFVFCAITFEPIKIQTCLAPQNDGLNLSFVKDTYADGEKLARNGRKTADSLIKDAVITVQFRIRLSIPYSLFFD